MHSSRAGHSTQPRVFQSLGTTCHCTRCTFYHLLNLSFGEWLIQALNEGMWSVHAWQKALDSLPKENLSPGEIKQKEQYQAGLKAASEPRVINISGGARSMPWDCAKAMKPDLILRGQEMATSSVSFGVFWSYNHYKNSFRLWHDRLG